MEDILIELRKELSESTDEATIAVSQRFFKEEIKFYGVKSSLVTKISKKYFNMVKNSGKEQIFEICEELFKSDYNEEAWIAADWVYNIRSEYQKDDIETFKSWIDKYINNWAKCDTFCNHSVGALIEKFPEHIKELKVWAKSKNRWLKRASAVSLIIPAKHGKFLSDVFAISDILLVDPDDMVQKGYGWALKEASRLHQSEVFDYVQKNKSVMPRTSLRYAIEKMPEELRKQAMAKA